MIRITIICVGKKHDALFVDAIRYYEHRLRPYCALAWKVIPASDIDKESDAIIQRVGSRYVMLLDEHGDNMTNEDVAQLFNRLKISARTDVALVIGGAYGVSQKVKKRADITLSLGSLTFPHQLVRVIAVEQLYRSLSLLSGAKYHHR